MTDPSAPNPPDGDGEEVCSTTEAARRLGVSNTTVQMMVERGDLAAWRTRGGHRRISAVSIERLKASREAPAGRRTTDALGVLLVEDDITLRTVYLQAIQGWKLPVRISVAGDGMEALLLIERERPDLVITDLLMAPVDGFRLLRMLRERREFDDMAVVAVTGLSASDIAAKGGLPKGVVVYDKPAPLDKLQGFIESSITRKQLAAR